MQHPKNSRKSKSITCGIPKLAKGSLIVFRAIGKGNQIL
jgi:hypothetical protein